MPRFIFAFLLLGLSSWICSLSLWERAGERAQYAAVTPHPSLSQRERELASCLWYWLGSGKRRQGRDDSSGRHAEHGTRCVAHDALNL